MRKAADFAAEILRHTQLLLRALRIDAAPPPQPTLLNQDVSRVGHAYVTMEVIDHTPTSMLTTVWHAEISGAHMTEEIPFVCAKTSAHKH